MMLLLTFLLVSVSMSGQEKALMMTTLKDFFERRIGKAMKRKRGKKEAAIEISV